MGPTRVNRKLSFESGEEQIKGYGKVTQNTEIFSTKYGNNILEVGSPDNGLSPIQREAIVWTNAEPLSIGPQDEFQQNLNENIENCFNENEIVHAISKIMATLSQPQYLDVYGVYQDRTL